MEGWFSRGYFTSLVWIILHSNYKWDILKWCVRKFSLMSKISEKSQWYDSYLYDLRLKWGASLSRNLAIQSYNENGDQLFFDIKSTSKTKRKLFCIPFSCSLYPITNHMQNWSMIHLLMFSTVTLVRNGWR